MKIYFGASITFDRTMLPVYQKIVAELKKLGHEVLTEHVVDPSLTDNGWQEEYDAQELFRRETERLDAADAMVAEVTKPSWGTAFLMEHALEHEKPVLALFYGEEEQPLPMMIQGHPELYVQHYDESTVRVTLEKSLNHFEHMNHRNGKLIVIDGGDGSGKATQTKMLLEYLKKHKIPSNYIAFPRYKTSFHGRHVGRFLTGEFGGNEEVSPYLSSLAFALDRLTARHTIIDWLEDGRVVVADRYVSASMAHQGSKLSGKKQKEFLDWLYSMEYKEHKLPKEDVVLFLYVPVEVAQKLLENSAGKSGKVNGKDIAEIDLEHQRKSIAMYKELSEKFDHWVMVSCVNDEGKLLSKEAIHKHIIAILKERKILV